MAGFASALTGLAQQIWNNDSVRVGVGVAVLALLLATEMLPGQWTSNEVNVYYLSYRWANPEAFGPYHSIFDDTYARTLGYLIMGSAIELLGFERAETVLSLAQWGVSAAAFYWMIRALKLGLTEGVIGLATMLLLNQSLFGGEWIFGGVETKTMAYIFLFLALGMVALHRTMVAMVLCAVAVYLHFLVGGFWGAALLVLIALRAGSIQQAISPGFVFAGLVAPLAIVIAWERLNSNAIDANALGVSVNWIYSEFRAPHHTAPFADLDGAFLAFWLPGWLMHIGFAVAALLMARASDKSDKPIYIWLLGLNLYAVLALGFAYLDRNTHLFAAFYIFRPSALILLLSLLYAAKYVTFHSRNDRFARVGLAMAVGITVLFIPRLVDSVHNATFGRVSLAETLSGRQKDMVSWIKENTSDDAVVLIAPSPRVGDEGDAYLPWVGMEILLQRPTLVNYKFVPTSKTDVLRWYELLNWRRLLLSGDCTAFEGARLNYVVTRTQNSADALQACGRTVWGHSDFAIVEIDQAKLSH